MFKPVPTRVDYVALEHDVQDQWDREQTLSKYLQRNQDAGKRWSFIDGPITANNPMGVHHAWGRSYKDLYNRFKTMQGYKLRYQNGFDCQGLWIEVEVEKELGFTNKKDIESYGIDAFVDACKERVRRFSAIQTQQSIRLGYWMDWDNSYYTNSDENNYTIWLFLKKCFDNGWLYKGKDSMPWCPRCGTGISQHEIVTEGYKEITHQSVYLKFPITSPSPATSGQTGRVSGVGEGTPGGWTPPSDQSESLLVWTTTPWTLAANIAAAVNPDLTYVRIRQGDDVLYVSKGAVATAIRGEHEVLGEVKGSELVGLTYSGPFDELPAQGGVEHRVIAWNDVSDEEGTGIVHIAPGAGAEDFALSKEYGLEVIAPLEEDGTYTLSADAKPGMRHGFGFLEGRFAGDVATDVFASLREKGILYRVQPYTHRYPTCWRCGSELVFRLVDEWFISMDELRYKVMDVTQRAKWIPEFGLAREMDWLKNMHDWMISKKRYYGLALPIYECKACGYFEVMGSEVELERRAIEGWDAFAGHSPHRPWIDAVKIACSTCGATVERIKDVGNPWLDAGIVPYSTLNYRHDRAYWEEWFPADWVSESFPGQFRNWFYSMLAMSAALEEMEPFKTLFGYALLRDEKGEEMHKSKGNAIWFEDAAERIGSDVMRWMFFRTPPANNLNFGWGAADEIKRNFLSTLWNTYSFFVTYANIDGWQPGQTGIRANGQGAAPNPTTPGQTGIRAYEQSGGQQGDAMSRHPEPVEGRGAREGQGSLSELDRWALSELNQLVRDVTNDLENYDSMAAARQIEDFVDGLSNWYVRRSRRRFWKPVLSKVEGSESDADKQAAYETLYTCLATLNRLLAPMTPFLAESIYQNLVRSWDAAAPESVHLLDYPVADESLIDEKLSNSVRVLQQLASLGRAARAKANLKVRQPLKEVIIRPPVGIGTLMLDIRQMENELAEELNVKHISIMSVGIGPDGASTVIGEMDRFDSMVFDYHVRLNLPILGSKYGGVLGQIQQAFATADKLTLARRKIAGLPVDLDGFSLQPDELLVTISGKPGYAVAEEAGYAVAVTTEVTPELADEGLARELVRRIQEMRKNAGFEIADRIRLSYEGDADIGRVMQSWRDYISQETLSEQVSAGISGGHIEEQNIDGRGVRLAVEKL
ncbi:MAG: isoleucine--tRNA ligase [Dehalococcoidia bacterium]|nr:isoleucine--tRNA ligase [Dehalococcoidia bacterium]